MELELLEKFFDGPLTAKDVGVPVAKLKGAEVDGLLVRKGEVRTGKRGRPAFSYSLSDKARKRVKRATNAA